MIGHLQGKILFSDGNEIILITNSGVGYQIYFPKVAREGSNLGVFISHVIKEASEELFGFETLREKKLFEMLLTVKGVGPKSAFALIRALGFETVCESISFENKKALTKAPGVGAKAAAQVILDLSNKIHKVKMFSPRYQVELEESESLDFEFDDQRELANTEVDSRPVVNTAVLDEALMACKELGFKEEKVIPMAQKILAANPIQKAEQLVHLVLKEM